MTLKKKILIVLGIFLVIGAIVLGLLFWGVLKISDKVADYMEPKMQQYVLMTEEEQNQFILSNMDELVDKYLDKDTVDEDAKEFREIFKNDPETQKAAVLWGRSVCAFLINNMDSVNEKLTLEQKARYIVEEKEMETRGEKVQDAIDRAEKANKLK